MIRYDDILCNLPFYKKYVYDGTFLIFRIPCSEINLVRGCTKACLEVLKHATRTEQQMFHLCSIRCFIIIVCSVSIVSFVGTALCIGSQKVFIVCVKCDL
jgi:hypothetical protein